MQICFLCLCSYSNWWINRISKLSVILTVFARRSSGSRLSLFNFNMGYVNKLYHTFPSTLLIFSLCGKQGPRGAAKTVITPSQNSSEFQTAAQHGKCRRASSLSARESRRQITALLPLSPFQEFGRLVLLLDDQDQHYLKLQGD